MRILIAGASGAIGRPLVHHLRANQQEVFALARSPDSAPLKEIGAEPVIADALDAATVKAAVGRIRPWVRVGLLPAAGVHIWSEMLHRNPNDIPPRRLGIGLLVSV
jgi:nucleoside-diphosphate-sugar epimerase